VPFFSSCLSSPGGRLSRLAKPFGIFFDFPPLPFDSPEVTSPLSALAGRPKYSSITLFSAAVNAARATRSARFASSPLVAANAANGKARPINRIR
jgi:hypothetical protein